MKMRLDEKAHGTAQCRALHKVGDQQTMQMSPSGSCIFTRLKLVWKRQDLTRAQEGVGRGAVHPSNESRLARHLKSPGSILALWRLKEEE